MKSSKEVSSVAGSSSPMKRSLSSTKTDIHGPDVTDVPSDNIESSSGCSPFNRRSDGFTRIRRNDGDTSLFAKRLNPECSPVLLNNISHAGSNRISMKSSKEISSVAGSSSPMKRSLSSTKTVIHGPDVTDVPSDNIESSSGCSPFNMRSDGFTRIRRNDGDTSLFAKSPYTESSSRINQPKLPDVDLNSLNKKRPSFNVDVFLSPKSQSQSLREYGKRSSPFYNGRTMFGGASVAECNKILNRIPSFPNINNRTPIRPIIRKPTSSKQSYGMSVATKKILEAIDQFSSPVMDAKKLLASTNVSGDNTNTPVMPITRKRKLPSLDDTVLTTAELLKFKKKPKLQDLTDATRELAKSGEKSCSATDQTDAIDPTPITLDSMAWNKRGHSIKKTESAAKTASNPVEKLSASTAKTVVNDAVTSLPFRLMSKRPLRREFAFSTPLSTKSIDTALLKKNCKNNNNNKHKCPSNNDDNVIKKKISSAATVSSADNLKLTPVVSGNVNNFSSSYFSRTTEEKNTSNVGPSSECRSEKVKSNIPFSAAQPVSTSKMQSPYSTIEISFNTGGGKSNEENKTPSRKTMSVIKNEEKEANTTNNAVKSFKFEMPGNKINSDTTTTTTSVSGSKVGGDSNVAINKISGDNINNKLSSGGLLWTTTPSQNNKWKCDHCWICNDKSRITCEACGAKNEQATSAAAPPVSLPTIKSSDPSSSGSEKCSTTIQTTSGLFKNTSASINASFSSGDLTGGFKFGEKQSVPSNNLVFSGNGGGFKFTTIPSDAKPQFNFINPTTTSIGISNSDEVKIFTTTSATTFGQDSSKIATNSLFSFIGNDKNNVRNKEETTTAASSPSGPAAKKIVGGFNFTASPSQFKSSFDSTKTAINFGSQNSSNNQNATVSSSSFSQQQQQPNTNAGGHHAFTFATTTNNNNITTNSVSSTGFSSVFERNSSVAPPTLTFSNLKSSPLIGSIQQQQQNSGTLLNGEHGKDSAGLTNNNNSLATTTVPPIIENNKFGGFSFPAKSEMNKLSTGFAVTTNSSGSSSSVVLTTTKTQSSAVTSSFANAFNKPTAPNSNNNNNNNIVFNKSPNDIINASSAVGNNNINNNNLIGKSPFISNNLTAALVTSSSTPTGAATAMSDQNSKRYFGNFTTTTSAATTTTTTANKQPSTNSFIFGSGRVQQQNTIFPSSPAIANNAVAAAPNRVIFGSSVAVGSTSPIFGSTMPNAAGGGGLFNSVGGNNNAAVFSEKIFSTPPQFNSARPQPQIALTDNGLTNNTANIFSNSTPDKTPIIFGNTAATNTFTFGSSGSINQTGPQQAAASVFNPSVPPSFNFSGGQQVTTFTAQPSSPSQANYARRFKKALRRKP